MRTEDHTFLFLQYFFVVFSIFGKSLKNVWNLYSLLDWSLVWRHLTGFVLFYEKKIVSLRVFKTIWTIYSYCPFIVYIHTVQPFNTVKVLGKGAQSNKTKQVASNELPLTCPNLFIFLGMECISEQDCTTHGWALVGGGCNVHEVTHSVPDVFFLCCFLMLGTFTIAYFIRGFRQSPYFPSIVSILQFRRLKISIVETNTHCGMPAGKVSNFPPSAATGLGLWLCL